MNATTDTNPRSRGSQTNARKFAEKWAHKRADCIATLKEPRSVGYTARLHDVPETAVKNWQREEGIPAYVGPKRRLAEIA